MTIVGSKETKKYRTGNKRFDITDGLYDIEYREVVRTYEGRPYTMVFLNKVTPAVPQDGTALQALLETVVNSNRAEKIMDGLDTSKDFDSLLDKIMDPVYLESIHGLGKKTANRILARLNQIDRFERNIIQKFRKWNIPYRRATARAQWASFYFKHNRHILEQFNRNPYTLLKISDQSERTVWSTANKEDAPPVGAYHFGEIDKIIINEDPRWESHRERLCYILYRAVSNVLDDGHSVSTINQVQDVLKQMNVTEVTGFNDDQDVVILGGEATPIDEEVITSLIRKTDRLVPTTFTDTFGVEQKGVTRSDVVKWQFQIADTVKTLTKAKGIFSSMRSQEMYNTALIHSDVTFTEEQKNAILNAYHKRISTITGGAGTGKTTIAQAILNGFLKATQPDQVIDPVNNKVTTSEALSLYILAPTGVAAQRIRLGLDLRDPVSGDKIIPNKIEWKRENNRNLLDDERSGGVCIGTLHSFLGYNGHYFSPPMAHPSVLYLDEASMVDEELMYELMRYVQSCLDNSIPIVLLMSGDEMQLPPVGIGFPFRDLMGPRFGSSLPTTKLTLVQRQAEDSMIVHASHDVLHGRLPPTIDNYQEWGLYHEEQDFLWVEPNGQVQDIQQLITEYTAYLNNHDVSKEKRIGEHDIQVILPLRNPSRVEAKALHVRASNKVLQEHFSEQRKRPLFQLKAASFSDPDIQFQVHFAEGDKVIHTGRNGYGGEKHEPIMRGSIGTIVNIDSDFSVRNQVVHVKYPWMDKPVKYSDPVEVGQLSLAYSITGHSAQGSEFDYALLVLPRRAGPGLIDRSWLYTAVTRAKKHLFMIGTTNRVAEAVSYSHGLARNTLLAKTLVQTY